jgi:4-amino-4-deoxy-L-arabinose transferase-like glycosyltransferase
MKTPAPWLSRWIRAQVFVAPVVILIALWIPGCDQGWLRTDSHKYTALALDCWTDGPLWAPQLGDQPYFNKPPLAFWIVGAVLRVTGPEVWAVRLTSLIAAIGAVVAVVDIARRLSGRRVALLTGVVLATTMEFARYTRAFSLDLWLTMFIVWAVWCVVVGAQRNRMAWVIAAALPIGAALMVKPFIIVFPMGLVAVWVACIGRARLIPALGAALVVGAAIAAPWHIAMARHFGEAFTGTYFGTQTVERLEGTMQDPNPWWYYLWKLVRSYLPWVVTLLAGVIAAALGRFSRRDRALVILSVLWIVGWLAITSAIGDRRARYLVPIYPLMAPISALWVARCLPGAMRRTGRVAMVWAAPAALTLGVIGALVPVTIHEDAEVKWPALIAELDRLGAWDEAWCAAGPYTNASNVYLRTGRWLRLAGPDDHGYGGAPPAGAVVVFFADDLTGRYADLGPVVWERGDLRLVRLERPWPDAPAE